MDWISANVNASPAPSLIVGRNLFVQDNPEIEDVQVTSPDFNPATEPTVTIFTDGGPGAIPSSSKGGRMEWNLRFILRLGVVPEIAKAFLEGLVESILKRVKGQKAGIYRIKGVNLLTRPTVFVRQGDGHAFTTATMKFFVVTGL
jgi:hypothetical protein